jgi:hypothetical protein
LTPTLKVKRKVVEQKWRKEIEEPVSRVRSPSNAISNSAFTVQWWQLDVDDRIRDLREMSTSSDP